LLSATVLSLPATTTAQEPAGHLLQIFEMHVQAGHNDQLKAGIAAWKECYLAQKGDRAWNTWQRQHGQGNVYVVAFRLNNWAALDTTHEAGQKCQSVVMEKITPHVHAEKGSSSYAKLVPAISRNAPVSDLIWVSNFRADDTRLMMRTVEQIIGAMAEAEGQPRGSGTTCRAGMRAAPIISPWCRSRTLPRWTTRAGRSGKSSPRCAARPKASACAPISGLPGSQLVVPVQAGARAEPQPLTH
jgi:hypothetical protein